MAQLVKNAAAMWEIWVGTLGWEDALEKGRALQYPLQYPGLENSRDCIVRGVSKSQTPLSNFHFHFHYAIYNWHSPPLLLLWSIYLQITLNI